MLTDFFSTNLALIFQGILAIPSTWLVTVMTLHTIIKKEDKSKLNLILSFLFSLVSVNKQWRRCQIKKILCIFERIHIIPMISKSVLADHVLCFIIYNFARWYVTMLAKDKRVWLMLRNSICSMSKNISHWTRTNMQIYRRICRLFCRNIIWWKTSNLSFRRLQSTHHEIETITSLFEPQ